MKILELFSGTKSISKVFVAHGWEALTIDNNRKSHPDLCFDMLDFSIDKLPGSWRAPDVIWASPPCTSFSVMVISRNYQGGRPYSSGAFVGLALVAKTLEIIRELKPTYYFIENPRGMLRDSYLMANLPRHTATYCQYGADYQKPTDIWTNADISLKACRAGDRCHEYQPRSYKQKVGYGVLKLGIQGLNNAEERGIIPPDLCEVIFQSCQRPPIGEGLKRFL
jgi:hypothetical protein